MKKIMKAACVAICIAMLCTVLAGCGCNDEKHLTYTGVTLTAGQVGVAYSQSIAKAEGDGSPSITYSLKSDTLPKGLSLSGDNVSGTPTEATSGAVKFTVIAKADGFAAAEAEFSITVDPGTLTYVGASLGTIWVGEQLSSPLSVTGATGAEGITYGLKVAGSLPLGLSLAPNGDITGIPTAASDGAISFVVVASAPNFADAEATFTITVSHSDVIHYVGGKLPDAVINEEYSQSVATAAAFGVDSDDITYNLSSGSAQLPAGLNLAAGVITGTPTMLASAVIVKVTASAAGFDDVTAEFELSVVPAPAKSYVFEVAVADLDEFNGGSIYYGGDHAGPTVLERTGTGNNDWDTAGHISNYFLQGTHNSPGETITWLIHSDTETTATIKMSLGIEIPGSFTMNSSTGGGGHIIALEDKPLTYGTDNSIVLSKTASGPIQFQVYTIAEVQLKEGNNTITFTTGENNWLANFEEAFSEHGGPAIDSLVIESNANLSWAAGYPRTDNLLWKFPNDIWTDPNL